MNWKECISSDPEIMFGKMVIKGTRIPVELILEKLAADYSFDDLKKANRVLPQLIYRLAYYLRPIILNMKKSLH